MSRDNPVAASCKVINSTEESSQAGAGRSRTGDIYGRNHIWHRSDFCMLRLGAHSFFLLFLN